MAQTSSTQSFAMGVPDDLVSPRAGSMTSRALVSFAQRSLFEARHRLGARLPEGSAEADAIARYLAIVAGMLPGSPHAIARSLRDPAVFVPARALLGGHEDAARCARAFVGSALLWLEREGVLDDAITLPFATRPLALGHGVVAAGEVRTFGRATACRALGAVEGRLVALEDGGPWFSLGFAEARGALGAGRVKQLREALAFVARFAKAERDDLDRLVAAFVCGTRSGEETPLGLVFVSPEATVEEDVRAILDAVVTEKLMLLRLFDGVATPFAPLATMCGRFVYLRTRITAARVTNTSSDERSLADALSALSDTFVSWRATAEISEIGEGVVSELSRGIDALR
jgi:hypothetical protein